jgi:phosphatidylinositol 4-kinase
MRRNIRREALERLAALSASSPNTSENDIARLSKRCPGPRSGSSASAPIPITLPELEALLALCKAAPHATRFEAAAQYLPQIAAYLPLCHSHVLKVSHSLPNSVPSPWEALTFNLADAVLSLGLRHPSLRQHASSTTARYLDSWLRVANMSLQVPMNASDDEEDELSSQAIGHLVTLSTSLLGFLEAAANNAQFWVPKERLMMLKMMRDALSENFMISLETALSIIRNARQSDGDFGKWKGYIRRYASSGRPLGAMLLRLSFMRLVTAFASLEVAASLEIEDTNQLARKDILEFLLSGNYVAPDSDTYTRDPVSEYIVEQLADIATNELRQLEDGSDYLQLGSAWLRKLGSAVKAFSFTSLLCCTILDENVVEPDNLRSRLESTMSDQLQIMDDQLASVVFKSIAILANISSDVGIRTSAILTKAIIQGGLDSRTAAVVAECLASVLKRLPQDSTITTLYSLGNALSTTRHHNDKTISTSPSFDNALKVHQNALLVQNGASMVSLNPSPHEDSSVYLTVIDATVRIARACGEAKVIALALTMLIQKISRINPEVDAKIVTESAVLGVFSAPNEFKSLLKLYSRLCHDGIVQNNQTLLNAVMSARLYLSNDLRPNSELFEVYLLHLLEAVVSKGDAPEFVGITNPFNKKIGDSELATQEIAQLLRPLAALAASNTQLLGEDNLGIEGLANLQRDAWFNAVAHGFTLDSSLGMKYRNELQTLAQFSMPLIAEDRTDQLESDIELNTTLRRGKSNDQAANLRKYLIKYVAKVEDDIKSLNYSELVFITSAHMVEYLRAGAGDCTKVLTYFLDTKLCSGDLGSCMVEVAKSVVVEYLRYTKLSVGQHFASRHVAEQLALFFAGCCHRISKVQEVAVACVELIVRNVPSSLCHKSSLYALFELLSILWISCLEQETEEYQWRSKFVSKKGNVEIELSDDYEFRSATLKSFYEKAKVWVRDVLDIAPLDIKGLIQTYLSEYADDGSYDHVSLGRSFALEIGGMIPSTDQRLRTVPHPADMPINTASDFIVQYTIRQEYRHIDSFQDGLEFAMNGSMTLDTEASSIERTLQEARKVLANIEQNPQAHGSLDSIRDVLRRTGALLCRSKGDQGDIVYHLVRIPFTLLTKQAIKLGISLWAGVIKENPRTESRILAEIAECWEDTIRKRRGLFDPRLKQLDPFFVKQEFAPSDRNMINRRQHFAYDLIAPHTRLLQFFSSHFHATRFGSPHVQRLYQRLMNVTMRALGDGIHHPLTREALLSVLILAAKVLKFSTNLTSPSLWRFKDRILSAALAWFADPPKWSYGGNKIQVRAEAALLSELLSALDLIRSVGQDTNGPRKSLGPKHELLAMLLSNEQTRLHVWLNTINTGHAPLMAHHNVTNESKLAAGLKVAWTENPNIAVELTRRFHSESLQASLRFLILNFPDKVLHSKDALEIILGDSLAPDTKLHLKVYPL